MMMRFMSFYSAKQSSFEGLRSHDGKEKNKGKEKDVETNEFIHKEDEGGGWVNMERAKAVLFWIQYSKGELHVGTALLK